MMSGRLFVVAALMAAMLGALRLSANTDYAPRVTLDSLPVQISDWSGRSLALDSADEGALRADSYVLRTYTRGASSFELFVAYYATQITGRTMHSPLNCLPGSGWSWEERNRRAVDLPTGRVIEINRNRAVRDNQALDIYYWYQSRTRVVASDYVNKLVLMHDALTRGRSEAALVRVVAARTRLGPASIQDAESFIRQAYLALARVLPE